MLFLYTTYLNLNIYILLTYLPKNNKISHVLISEVECWDDYNKRMIPIILGAVAAAVCLIAILTYVLVRERRNQGYEQLWDSTCVLWRWITRFNYVLHCVDIALNDLSKQLKCNWHEILLEMCFL